MKAFPWQEWINTADPYTMNPVSHGGMDLRDYFAAKAMQGIISRNNRKFDLSDVQLCYQVADAMMKEREQK